MIGGRQTYPYFEGTPLFRFGAGGAGSVTVSFTVTNTGEVAADPVSVAGSGRSG